MVDPDKPSKCKVGITKNKEQRLRAYRTAAPKARFDLFEEIPAKYHERVIIDILKDIFVVDREYIHAPPQIVMNVVEGYLIDIHSDHVNQ
jgi:hypothetical protein